MPRKPKPAKRKGYRAGTRVSNGEGAISEYAPGRWRGRFTWRAPDGTSKRISFRGASEAEVVHAWAEWKREQAAPQESHGVSTVATLLVTYLSEVVQRRSAASTFRTLVSRAKTISAGIGKTPLGELTPLDVQRWVNDMEDSGKQPSTVRQLYVLLHSALDQAVDWELLDRNPAGKQTLPKLERREQHILSPEQIATIIRTAEARADPLAPYWLLLIVSGMRRTEAVSLRWQDVDLDAGRITLRGQYVRDADGVFAWSALKTRAANRTIDLMPSVVARLRLHRAAQQPASELLFPSVRGKPLASSTVDHYWQRLLDAAGVPRFRLHDLRHTVATMLVSDQEPFAVVAKLLGHSSPSVTVAFYSHVLPGAESGAVRHLDRLLGGGLRPIGPAIGPDDAAAPAC